MPTRRLSRVAARLLFPFVLFSSLVLFSLVREAGAKSLAGDAGPVHLIASDNAGPGRWVYGVRVVTVIGGARTGPGSAE